MPHKPETRKAYLLANKERLAARDKAYKETNKDEILAKRQEKIICECGEEIAKFSKWYHLKSKRHQEKLN
jgi:hypothetical protein